MNRSVALNYTLIGALAGVLGANACNGTGTANAQDCACFDGPIQVEVVSTTRDPLPVMICDGGEVSGLCAEVRTFGTQTVLLSD